MLTISNTVLSKHLSSIVGRIPVAIKLDREDFGFIVLMAICKMNGSRIEGQDIYHGNVLVGRQLNYRFDGYILEFAYISSLQNRVVSSSIRVM